MSSLEVKKTKKTNKKNTFHVKEKSENGKLSVLKSFPGQKLKTAFCTIPLCQYCT